MKKNYIIFALLAVFSLFFAVAPKVEAATLAQTYSGRILIDSQIPADAWYVEPSSQLRYFIGTPADAYALMVKFGVGISEGNFQKIAQGGTNVSGNLTVAKKYSGKIILQVERAGEAWYVNPVNLKKYYLGKQSEALVALRQVAVKVSHENIGKIPKAYKDDAANSFSNYKFNKKIVTANRTLYADIVEVDLGKLTPKIVTDTAGVENCSAKCPTKPLADFVSNQKAFAAINGVYGAPFYNTLSRRMVNANRLNSATPVIAFDENNKFYYFASGNQFSAVNFSSIYGVNLSAAFAGGTKLVEKGVVKTNAGTVRATRNAFGFKKAGTNPQGNVYLVSVKNATVGDLARAMKSIGVDYAVSLDAGAYSAMHYNNEYKIGPNSNVPNAILFIKK